MSNELTSKISVTPRNIIKPTERTNTPAVKPTDSSDRLEDENQKPGKQRRGKRKGRYIDLEV